MTVARRGRWGGLLLLALVAAGIPVAGAEKIDLREYYPLADGNSWTYQFRTFQPDGQINYTMKTYRAQGQEELKNGVKAVKLVDQRGWYYLLTVDADRYLHYGENEDKGLVTNEPPFAFYDTAYAFGKLYQSAHLISDGSARGAEVVFDGFESLSTPAGEFKDCLKATFKYINPNGSTFTSITWMAKGVGPVRKEFLIYSPKAGQVLRFDRELIHAVVGGQKVGGNTVADLGAYFPFFQGDEWTYDWSYTLPDGTSRTEERTRAFVATEFFNQTAAFKLQDSKGSYQYYTYDARNGIMMHASFENRPGGQVFTYQPALTLARGDMALGRSYTWSEAEAEQPENAGRYKRLQHWTASVEGYQHLETPLGRFETLRTRLSWTTSKARVSQTYYFARNVGLVGVDYESLDRVTGKRAIGLTARVKRAKLQGDVVATLADLDAHVQKATAAKAALTDDPAARAIFKAASLNRYVWDGGFPGLKGELEIVDHGGAPLRAQVTVDKNLVVDFDCEKCSADLRALARAQISQYVTHRAPDDFEEKYGSGKAFFQMVGKRPDGSHEIRVEGDTAMGSWYLIEGKEVRKLTRKLGGPVEFMINHEKNIKTEDGRYIANYYPVDFYMVQGDKKIPLGQVVYDDVFEKRGKWWLPRHRILKGKMPQPDRTILDVDLQVRFTSVAYLGEAAPVASRP
jgi:hypothetical protein